MTLKSHQNRLRKMARQAAPAAARALYAGGQLLESEAERSITDGAISGANHVPSLPGQPPNEDTGTLRRNIETEIGGPNLVTVTSYAPYSAALEWGSERKAGKAVRSFSAKSGKHGPVLMEYGDSKTPARPYMRPAAEKTRPEITKLVGRAISLTVR